MNPTCSSLGFISTNQLLEITGSCDSHHVCLSPWHWVDLWNSSSLPPSSRYPRYLGAIPHCLFKVPLLTCSLHFRLQGEHTCLIEALSYLSTSPWRLFSCCYCCMGLLPQNLPLLPRKTLTLCYHQPDLPHIKLEVRS